jgi:Cft2 family RNA processing exonuclease
MVGHNNLQILLIRQLEENHKIDLEIMVHSKLNHIHGLMVLIGKKLKIKKFYLHSMLSI